MGAISSLCAGIFRRVRPRLCYSTDVCEEKPWINSGWSGTAAVEWFLHISI